MVADLLPKAPKKDAANRGNKDIEGRQSRPKHETVAKKTTGSKEAATPSKKRKAAEDLEEDSDGVSDDAKGATSNIYKKRKVVPEAKAEAVADTKLAEREARVSSAKKRKAEDALDGDAVRGVAHGEHAPSTKKRRTKDESVTETPPLEEEAAVPLKNVKTEEVFVPLRRPSWSGSHVPIGFTFFKTHGPSSKFNCSKGPKERGPQL